MNSMYDTDTGADASSWLVMAASQQAVSLAVQQVIAAQYALVVVTIAALLVLRGTSIG